VRDSQLCIFTAFKKLTTLDEKVRIILAENGRKKLEKKKSNYEFSLIAFMQKKVKST
jgi:hypothetical protein